MKSKTIGFLLDQTQQYTLVPEKELLSGHYWEVAGLHSACDSTMCALKSDSQGA